MNEYDVIIVGAGPAGSMLAYFLSEKGRNVLLLDKAKFPRDKPCGGGLTAKTVGLFPFDISHLFRSEISRLVFTRKFRDKFSGPLMQEPIKIVDRAEFDNFLVKKAIEKGANFFQDTKIYKNYEEGNCIIAVAEDGRQYKSKLLVGADGALGMTSTFVSSEKKSPFSWLVAIKCEIPTRDSIKNFKKEAKIDWGSIPGGYAWLFPIRDKFNIGAVAPIEMGNRLQQYLTEWINFNGFRESKKNFIGHPGKCRVNINTSIVKGNILLIGEAAGLVDYWTGEGIYYAVLSAKIAGQKINEYFSAENYELLKEYNKEIEQEIMQDLVCAFATSKIVKTHSWIIHKMAKFNKSGFDFGYGIASGRKKYRDFKKMINALKWISWN